MNDIFNICLLSILLLMFLVTGRSLSVVSVSSNFLVVADNLLYYNLLIKCEVKSLLTVLALLLSVLMLVSFWSCFPKNLCTFWFVNRSCNLLRETLTTWLFTFFGIFSSSSSSWCTSEICLFSWCCFSEV